MVRGEMTVAEAGRRGGRATAAKLGPDGMRALGRRGAAVWAATSTPQQRAAVSRTGGRATRDTLGHDHYVAIGRRGGEALRDWAAGTDYYSRISRMRKTRCSAAGDPSNERTADSSPAMVDGPESRFGPPKRAAGEDS